MKIIKHDRLHSQADLLEILEYSETYRGGEGDRRVNPDGGCRYFGEWYVQSSISFLGQIQAVLGHPFDGCLPKGSIMCSLICDSIYMGTGIETDV